MNELIEQRQNTDNIKQGATDASLLSRMVESKVPAGQDPS